MRKLGLIGGLSWTSTARYYKLINELVQRELGGLHSAPLLIDSIDFADVARCATTNDWDCATSEMTSAARRLEAGGAQGILICANSMHKIYDEIAASVSIPVLHIIDEIGKKVKAANIKTAALIGTSNVMTDREYRQRLVSASGLSLLPADVELAARIDTLVYDELAVGKITREAERFMKTELTNIAKADVQAVVLACTELELIMDVRANVLPIYDSTMIHAEAGARFVLDK